MKNSGSLKLKKRIFSEEEAAIYLGRTVNAIREMRYDGKLIFFRDGRRILYDIIDLDKWIEQAKAQTVC
jgi:excisionase family DNA binding protein